MKLSQSKVIILFRFHKDIPIAIEKLRILKHFNPNVPIYGLFGGSSTDFEAANQAASNELLEHLWLFPEGKRPEWKWFHTDLMTKAWFRDFGQDLTFDFVYSYEYDLLTLKPLLEIYPDIDDRTLALAAVTKLQNVEWSWSWTSGDQKRPNWLAFKNYMHQQYGLVEQEYVCLGPGPLLPRSFLNDFADTEDVEWVHEEITLPAYAQVLGYELIDHGMHPGFTVTPDEKYFSCRTDFRVSEELVKNELQRPDGRRTFHPVKQMFTLNDLAL